MLYIHDVARVCHEANRALCEVLGDTTQVRWEDAPEWQKESAVEGVTFCLAHPNAPASANHEEWFKKKTKDGWIYGTTKDAERKTHPCMVSYEDLPEQQQAKDYLFKAVCGSLTAFVILPEIGG